MICSNSINVAFNMVTALATIPIHCSLGDIEKPRLPIRIRFTGGRKQGRKTRIDSFDEG